MARSSKPRCMPWRRCWCRQRNTEKTSAVLGPQDVGAGRRDRQTGRIDPDRTRAQWRRGVYRRAEGRSRARHDSKPATAARSAARAKCTARRSRKRWCGSWGRRRWRQRCIELERLRCNACGQVFTADEPEAAGPEKYDETAAAMIAQLKYGSGVPFHRLEQTGRHIWGFRCRQRRSGSLMEAAAELIRPALDELIRQAAQGEVMHNDDTGMRILRLAREPGDKRTGMFTSGIVSIGRGWTIALFFTGWKHAGENLAEVLKQRARELPAPIQMCDALSRNVPKLSEGVEILLANCLAHGRRQFVEVAENFPEECRYVLETLGEVYHHDAQAREQATVAGTAAALPSGAQRAGDERAA